MGKVVALGFAVLGSVIVLTYNVTKMAEMVIKRTTATDRITRHIHERDVRFLELDETLTSASNFSIFRTQKAGEFLVPSNIR